MVHRALVAMAWRSWAALVIVDMLAAPSDITITCGGGSSPHGSCNDEMQISVRLTGGGGDIEGGRWWWHPGRQWRDGRIEGRGGRVRRRGWPEGATEGEERLRKFLWYIIAVGCINAPSNLKLLDYKNVSCTIINTMHCRMTLFSNILLF